MDIQNVKQLCRKRYFKNISMRLLSEKFPKLQFSYI